MAREVATHQLHQRLVPVEPTTFRDALVDECVRLLLPGEPAAPDECLELAVHEDVRHPLARPVDARIVEDGPDLVPSQAFAALERRCDHPLAAGQGSVVQPELAASAGAPLLHARAAEREEPAEVVPSDEVPRRSEHVRPDDRTGRHCLIEVPVGETLRALTDGPFRGTVVLRLHREMPSDGLFGRRETGPSQP